MALTNGGRYHRVVAFCLFGAGAAVSGKDRAHLSAGLVAAESSSRFTGSGYRGCQSTSRRPDIIMRHRHASRRRLAPPGSDRSLPRMRRWVNIAAHRIGARGPRTRKPGRPPRSVPCRCKDSRRSGSRWPPGTSSEARASAIDQSPLPPAGETGFQQGGCSSSGKAAVHLRLAQPMLSHDFHGSGRGCRNCRTASPETRCLVAVPAGTEHGPDGRAFSAGREEQGGHPFAESTVQWHEVPVDA